MALGFGFNKAKVLSSAEKYVQQGKLQNAIGEYEKVAKEDPKDLTVLNTIGDLCARLGQTDKAAAHFKKVGDAYAADGFTVKAIAMYKKLTKLNPNAVEAVQKLAELYTQQGLYNDARQQYVVVADYWMKANDLEGAARVFQKMLELDPENAAMQTKLADLYIRMGKKEDAKQIYFRAADSLYQRAAMDAADEALGRILSIDPTNSRALLKRGQIALDAGNAAAALRHLERISNLDDNPDALSVVLRARMQAGQQAESEALARKLATAHKDLSGLVAYAEWLVSTGAWEQGLAMYGEVSDHMLRSNPESLARVLESAVSKVKENAPALEVVLQLYRKLGDKPHMQETSELLAHALVQAGDLRRARDLYRELADSEPENPAHEQHYRQVLAKLGEDAAVRPLTAAEGAQAFMVDELEISAPMLRQQYPDEVEDAIKSALTDSELLDSYGLPEKALVPLERVLGNAPHDALLNQRLASLYAAAGRFADAANCCDVLQSLYREAGHAEQARAYADMAARYRGRPEAAEAPPLAQAAAAAAAPAAAAEFAIPLEPPAEAAPAEFSVEVQPAAFSEFEPAAVAPPPAAPAAGHEIDLSEEWETHAVAEAPAAPLASPADILEEIRFYISQSMWEEARSTCLRCQTVAPDHPELAGLKAQIEAATAPAAAPAFAIEVTPPGEPSVSEFVFGPTALGEPAAAAEAITPEAVIEVVPPAPEPVAVPEPVVAAAPEVVEAPPPPPPVAPPPVAAAPAAADALSDFVLDLDESLGADFALGKPAAAPPPPVEKAPAAPLAPKVAPPPPLAAVPPAPAQVSTEETSSMLSDMFAEFKEDAEEGAKEAEDPETHYNLGVAFREMGLLDEAIGELQKVCQAVDKGAPFRDLMQAYTWLAQCFVDKGVPEASYKWYERALKVATDEEQRLSLHYDLAAACELGGNKQAALQHFLEVYGSNIDYRDVAERIKALRS